MVCLLQLIWYSLLVVALTNLICFSLCIDYQSPAYVETEGSRINSEAYTKSSRIVFENRETAPREKEKAKRKSFSDRKFESRNVSSNLLKNTSSHSKPIKNNRKKTDNNFYSDLGNLLNLNSSAQSEVLPVSFTHTDPNSLDERLLKSSPDKTVVAVNHSSQDSTVALREPSTPSPNSYSAVSSLLTCIYHITFSQNISIFRQAATKHVNELFLQTLSEQSRIINEPKCDNSVKNVVPELRLLSHTPLEPNNFLDQRSYSVFYIGCGSDHIFTANWSPGNNGGGGGSKSNGTVSTDAIEQPKSGVNPSTKSIPPVVITIQPTVMSPALSTLYSISTHLFVTNSTPGDNNETAAADDSASHLSDATGFGAFLWTVAIRQWLVASLLSIIPLTTIIGRHRIQFRLVK